MILEFRKIKKGEYDGAVGSDGAIGPAGRDGAEGIKGHNGNGN